ncbi:MAG: sugar phosphate isomerase/epimerase [Planctomycetes bacterium]|nr:sugar phosphate isomerase/epimerase [Planctomycetota bacterium]
MKKGICMGCLPGDTAEAKLRLAKELGFQGVEIHAHDQDETVLEWKRIADRVGLEIPSIMGGPHWSHPLSSPDPAVRKVCNESIKRSLMQARRIGATAVLLVPAVVNADITYEQAWERSLKEVKDIARAAEEQRVTLAIENVWNKFLLSPIEFNHYLDEVGSPWVKAYFDCGNIVLYGFPQHWIRSLGKRIVKIHVKGFTGYPNVAFPNSLLSDVPWKACREAWQAIGYDDYLTVEIGPKKDDPAGSIRLYSEQLSRIIAGE